MVSVENYMWISTSEQKLFVVHTPSMKTVISVSLKNADQTVVNLLHVMEWHVVMVMWSGSAVWYLQDKFDDSKIRVLDKKKLESPLLHCCKVILPGRVEVWGTQQNGKVVILDWSSMGQNTSTLSPPMVTNCNRQPDCEHITSSYTRRDDNLNGSVQVWVTFKQELRLGCWDAVTRSSFYSVKIASKSKIHRY